jgi:hypothetical protein
MRRPKIFGARLLGIAVLPVALTMPAVATSATGSALYTATNITPTSPASVKCVAVQSTGSVPSTVRFYTGGVTNTPTGNALVQYLKIQVEIGTVGSTCSSFTTGSSIVAAGTTLSTLEGFTSYASSKDTTWAPAGGTTETRVFRFTVTPDSTMPNSLQGASTGVSFIWEADNS